MNSDVVPGKLTFGNQTLWGRNLH